MKRILSAIFLLSAMLLAAVEVNTRVSSNAVSVQESLNYVIEVVLQDGGRGTPQVQLPVFPNGFPFQVSGPQGPQTSSSTMVRSINGRTTTTVTRTLSYVYRLTPKRAGTLQIPAMTVQVDGTDFRTLPVTVAVAAAGSHEDPASGITLRQSLDVQEAIPGMPVRLRYEFTFPQEKVYRNSIDSDVPVEALSRAFRLPKDFAWHIWHAAQRNVNGILCQVMTLEVELVPLKPGTIALPPFTMTMDVPDPNARQQRRRDPFGFFDDDPFFRRTPTRRLNLMSNELTLHVGELPEEGRPADFSGLVGQVEASVKLSQTEVNVGDPIVAEIALSGPGIGPETRLPPLKENAAVTSQFSVSGDDEPPRRDEATGALVFQATLRAKAAGDLLFPDLQIPYYDLAAKGYRTAATTPVAVKASAVRQVTLEDATIAGGAAPSVAAPSAPQPEKNMQGLAADYSAREVLEDTTATRTGGLLLCALAAAALWLVCLVVRLATLLRLASPETRARHAALRELRRAAKAYRPGNSAAADALYHALREYAIRRFGLPGGTFGPADLDGKGLSQKQLENWRAALETVDAIRYAGGAPERETLLKLIRNVEA